CAPGDTSAWATDEFTTPCAPFTAPYYTGFESMAINVNADCWSNLTTYPNGNVWVRNFNSSLGIQSFHLSPSFGYTTTDTLAIISPEFTDLTAANKRIRFDANVANVTIQLIVGTVDFPGTGGTYTPMDTVNFATANAYANYTVEFTTANGYNGTDQYVYMAHSLPVTTTFVDIRIDEFRYEDIPSCVRPTNANVTATTSTTADLAWTNGTTPAAQWAVEYGLQGFTPGSGTTVIAAANPYTITGLTAGTIYEAYVRAICAPGDTSLIDAAAGFFTDCSPITVTNLPFTEDWETGGSGTVLGSGIVKCGPDFQWAFVTNDPQGRARFGNTAANVGSGTGAITLDREVSGAVTRNELILTLDLSAQTTNTSLSLTFDAMEHGEENSPGDSTWMRGSDTDPWVGFLDNFVSITNTVTYDPFGPYDVDAILAAAGQTVSSTFQIRFGQEDNFPTPSDGFSFDNIWIYDAVTSIEEIATNELFAITPNPSNGLFTLNMKVDRSENLTMTVRDVKGQVVYTEGLTVQGAYTNNLDFTSFAKGVYYMQIQTETESKVEKLVIQ
ncbi:MAG: T9SS type A sorting domain-containing protein, partial [Flavobacteriales bacterium]|nr:T9SS type A sorting domain-containing protein [Flavobacteriales bacterium]